MLTMPVLGLGRAVGPAELGVLAAQRGIADPVQLVELGQQVAAADVELLHIILKHNKRRGTAVVRIRQTRILHAGASDGGDSSRC